MELTQEHFDQTIKGLAAKEDLKDFATKTDLQSFITKEDAKDFATAKDLAMVQNVVSAIKKGMANFATAEELKEVKETVVEIHTTLNRQTTVLDGIAKYVEKLDDERIVDGERLKKVEQKLGLAN
jgi:hypothetical protein